MMMRDSSTATSKRKREVRTTAVAMEGDHGDDQDRVASSAAGPAAAASSSAWTEDMHSSFLNRMEAAFVHDILFRWPPAAAANHRLHHQQQPASTATDATPRLDRYMPDSAESTCDAHGDAPPAAAASGIKRCRPGRNARRNGCTADAGDISALFDGATKADSTTSDHPLSGPPKESDDDEADQVVPLFQMPETATHEADAANANNKRQSPDLK